MRPHFPAAGAGKDWHSIGGYGKTLSSFLGAGDGNYKTSGASDGINVKLCLDLAHRCTFGCTSGVSSRAFNMLIQCTKCEIQRVQHDIVASRFPRSITGITRATSSNTILSSALCLVRLSEEQASLQSLFSKNASIRRKENVSSFHGHYHLAANPSFWFEKFISTQ